MDFERMAQLAQDSSATTIAVAIVGGVAAALVTIYTGAIGPVIHLLKKQAEDLKIETAREIKELKASAVAEREELKKDYDERSEIMEAKHEVHLGRLYQELEQCEKEREAAMLWRARYEERVHILEKVVEGKVTARFDENHNLRIVSVNLGMSKLFGYTRDELIGQPVEILVAPQQRNFHLERVKEHIMDSDPSWTKAFNDGLAIDKHGRVFPVVVEIKKVNVPGGLAFQAIITQD